MKQSIVRTGVAFTLGLIIVSFQNCGQVQNGLAVQDQSSKLSNEVIDTDTIRGVVTQVEQTPPAAPANPSQVNPPKDIVIHPTLPPKDDELHCLDDVNCNPAQPVPVLDSEINEALHLCKVIGLREISDETHKDKRLVRITQAAGHIARLNGKHVIVGMTAASSIESLSLVNGTQVLCGVHVKRVNRSQGRLILVNASIDEMDDHHGRIDLIDSRVKNLTGSNCTVVKHILNAE